MGIELHIHAVQMEIITTEKLSKYLLYINFYMALITFAPVFEQRTQFFMSSILCQLLFQSTSLILTPFRPDHVEYSMNTPEVIRNNGYEAEIHHVNSSQYYRLELHRIPIGNYFKETERKLPVLLHHGIFCSSADFVVNKPHEGLAYLLADSGYDVWIANTRGNYYSRYNYKISSEDVQFWDFSADDIIEHDMPAVIDYILQTTNYSQLYYIGHSLGSTLAFGILASKPEYNKKIKALIALAPAIYTPGAHGFVKLFVQTLAYDYFENGEIMAKMSGFGYIAATVLNSPFYYLGRKFMEFSTGDKYGSLNETLLPLHLNHLPSGISKRILRHLGQMHVLERFSMYDWGKEVNKKVYKQEFPPSYDLNQVTTPTHIFYAENDILTPPIGAHQLAAELPNCTLYQAGTPNSGHMSHIWGSNISHYKRIIELFES